MKIAVSDNEGNVYTNNTDNMHDGDKTIIEIHFSTSYTQLIVQDLIEDDKGNKSYPTKDIIIPIEDADGLSQAIDMIAVSSNEIGSWA